MNSIHFAKAIKTNDRYEIPYPTAERTKFEFYLIQKYC